MKISHFDIVKTSVTSKGDWIWIAIHTDEGLVGYGEATQSGNDAMTVLALRHFEKELVGQDPSNIISLWQQMVYPKTVFSGDMGRVGQTAISAIDQALWDIKGKALGTPVWQLLGGKLRDKIRVYANLNRGIFDRSPAGFATAAKSAIGAGFNAIKCTPFDEVDYKKADRAGVDADIDIGIARLAEVRNAVGSDVDLLVDCQGRFDYPTAVSVIEKLKPLNPFWVEEPVPEEQTQSLATLSKQSGVRIAGAETLFGRAAFTHALERGATHVIMPDIKHCGGISEMMKIAAIAEMYQVSVSPHSPAGPISNAAGLHVAAAMPNFLALEYAFGEVDWRTDSCIPKEVISEGFMEVPTAPGLGVVPNMNQGNHSYL